MSQPDPDFARVADPHRRELLVHCYRLLGSFHDAEDAVQETYLRAWRGFDRFEARSSVRTWLYRIATNVCLTALEGKQRRVLPAGLGAGNTDWQVPLGERRYDIPWLEPLPDPPGQGEQDDPAEIAVRRESTRLAFVAALQHLPARQRAALVLRDVLDWSAAEVAELLDTSVAAVNSALQRARAQLAGDAPAEEEMGMTADVDEQVVRQFMAAFENADVAALSELLRHDVELEMPPIPTWFTGKDAVLGFFRQKVLTGVFRRMLPVRANGCPATATYRREEDGHFYAHSIQVLETEDGAIRHVYVFLDTSMFTAFGLPQVLDP
jgi:RNA polymerase sigma-70 factor (ECF subfamily)